MSDGSKTGLELEDLRRQKALFDTAWDLATLLAASLVVLSRYFDLARVDVTPVIWTLALLGFALLGLRSQTDRARSGARLRSLALWSQLTGTTFFAVAWHYFGGLDQPLFPLFVMLPLVTGSLLFGFWEQAAATLALVALLIAAVLFSPDASAFMEERYGLGFLPAHLASWVPKSASAFAVTDSPHDLLLMATVAAVAIAVSSTSRALAGICTRAAERVRFLENEVGRLERLAQDLVTRAPAAQVLVQSSSGRIVNGSDRFMRAFGLPDATGLFLLDAIEFSYPAVIKRLFSGGGEEIQGATLGDRHLMLRVRAEILGSGDLAAVSIERCDDICWHGEVDALDEPVFAVDSRGEIAFPNRSALDAFGERADGTSAFRLFNTGMTLRWWDIAPLDSARRLVERSGRRYIASIRRKRIADTIGELSFVHLQEIGKMHVVAAS